jgi:hypothetical protein
MPAGFFQIFGSAQHLLYHPFIFFLRIGSYLLVWRYAREAMTIPIRGRAASAESAEKNQGEKPAQTNNKVKR